MDQRNVPAIAYRLWNPRAAAAWGFFVVPLGACLHALNWREIGEPQRARTNLIWMWGVLAFALVLTAVAVLLPTNLLVDALSRSTGLLLWTLWYLTQGRAQVQYVNSLGDGNYIKKGWTRPLLASFGALALCFVFGFTLAYVHAYATLPRAPKTRDPVELAAWVEPRILRKWHEHKVLADATIQKVSLDRKDGSTYAGFVDATIDGKPERIPLNLIIYDDRSFDWNMKKADQGAPVSK